MVTITLGRHGIMDENAGITPLSMLAAYFSGKDLLQYGPALVLSSSVKRAEITAQIRNLVLRAPLLFLPELHDNPDLIIEISAHTDNVGNADYNIMLSERRAQSVANYIVESGIQQNRLQSKGYGMTKPLVPNDSEENRAINRRVEFVVLATKNIQQ